jgi:hypothetical protein
VFARPCLNCQPPFCCCCCSVLCFCLYFYLKLTLFFSLDVFTDKTVGEFLISAVFLSQSLRTEPETQRRFGHSYLEECASSTHTLNKLIERRRQKKEFLNSLIPLEVQVFVVFF